MSRATNQILHSLSRPYLLQTFHSHIHITPDIIIMAPSARSRALGAIWGTCIGDALGGPIQFQKPGTFDQIKELEFVKPFNQPSG